MEDAAAADEYNAVLLDLEKLRATRAEDAVPTQQEIELDKRGAALEPRYLAWVRQQKLPANLKFIDAIRWSVRSIHAELQERQEEFDQYFPGLYLQVTTEERTPRAYAYRLPAQDSGPTMYVIEISQGLIVNVAALAFVAMFSSQF